MGQINESGKKKFKEVEHLLDERFAASIRSDWRGVNISEMILGIYGFGQWKISTPETRRAGGASA